METECAVKKLIKNKKDRSGAVRAALKEVYPDVRCGLHFEGDPFRLLVMARLSAQCTDKRVNTVSGELFKRLPDARAAADAPIELIEELIKPCGLYHTKAKNIRDMSRALCEKYGGAVPSGMDELLSLPGVGRKIANLIRTDVFGLSGIVADTHCIRLTYRWGLSKKPDPNDTENSLLKLIPPEEQGDFCHRCVEFGREYCSARSPRCAECPILKKCEVDQ